MSFSSRAKAELCQARPDRKCCAIAESYGVLLYCNTFSANEIRVITASPEFFEGRKTAEVKAFFTEAVSFMEKKLGKGNIFSAVVHMDEKTPHLHLCFTPITQDGRLSAKDLSKFSIAAIWHLRKPVESNAGKFFRLLRSVVELFNNF